VFETLEMFTALEELAEGAADGFVDGAALEVAVEATAGLVDDATVELAGGTAAGLLAGSLIGSGLALSFETGDILGFWTLEALCTEES
jgi:hypothetical protein